MRCVLAVLLGLSLPAYATVYHVDAKFEEASLIGSFTVVNNKITEWSIGGLLLPNGQPTLASDRNCFFAPPEQCNKAEIVTPTHLNFFYEFSPSTTTALDLFLERPLDDGTIKLLPETDYRRQYGQIHFTFISGSVNPMASAVPEPSTLLILACLGIPLAGLLKARQRYRCS
jgi:hypothetical protein